VLGGGKSRNGRKGCHKETGGNINRARFNGPASSFPREGRERRAIRGKEEQKDAHPAAGLI